MTEESKQPVTAMTMLKRESVVENFQKVLWKKANAFVSSLLSIVSSSDYLKNAEPLSVYNAAMVAASLDLPINPNLGFAYIVPYKGKWQFQMGYKWYIQLAHRTGLFLRISVTPVQEWQLVEENPIRGNTYNRKIKSDNTIWYLAYFKLTNWFEAELFLGRDEMMKHAKKYSKSFAKWEWLRKDEFDMMAQKTAIKLLLSKYAPLSTEMQLAISSDQSIVKDPENLEFEYEDNPQKIEEQKTAFADRLKEQFPDFYVEWMHEEEAKRQYFNLLNAADDGGNWKANS